MKEYNKKPLTFKEQVELLKSRGLIVNNQAKAELYFQQISYYRFSAYSLPYQRVKDSFNEGTSFENILDIYLFDRELRLLVFNAIERIEVTIRTQIIYQLAHKYGSHWQDEKSIFKLSGEYGKNAFSEMQKTISEQRNAKHPEVFIKHYREEYSTPYNPPSWMCIELLTIGQLSRLFTALRNNADKESIAIFFGLHHTIFSSWIHAIVYIRNICAHHSRLWNRDFGVKPLLLLKPKQQWTELSFMNNNHRCFYFLCLLKYMLQAANPTNHIKQHLIDLIEKYPSVPIQLLGIPSDGKGNLIDWQNDLLWQK